MHSMAMTRDEHLMVIAMEECAEVAQRLSKALRFGLREIQPKQDLDNRARIQYEFNDLLGVMAELGYTVDAHDGAAKMEKVERYLEYSAKQGTLSGTSK